MEAVIEQINSRHGQVAMLQVVKDNGGGHRSLQIIKFFHHWQHDHLAFIGFSPS